MPDALTLLIIFIFGSAVGSFLNVVAYRSVHGGDIISDRSKCPHCKHRLEAVDLLPILSFIILRGNCRYCRQKISWHYPIVEFSTAALFVVAYLVTPVIITPTLNLTSITLYLYVIFVIYCCCSII